MAVVTRTGTQGGASFSFDFDDVSLELIAVRVDNRDTRVFNIEVPKGTFSVDPGQSIDRTLNGPQRESYTVTLIPRGDGTNRVVFNFAWRAYFS